MARQKKTPRQRAEEQLEAAERAVERLATKRTALQREINEVAWAHDRAVARRDYLANHPDLSSTPTATTEENDA